MRKLLLLALALPAIGSAQVFGENWDGIGPGMTGWTRYNVDALAPNANVAFVNNSWVSAVEEYGNNVGMSTSWYTPAGTSNDWLVSPAITVPATGTATLYWDARSYDATFRDSYKVFINTVGNTVANFTATTPVFTQGTGANGAAGNGENLAWTRRSVDLSAYAGQTIYVGFQNFSNDNFLLAVDNVFVTTGCAPVARDLTATNSTLDSFTINWPAITGVTDYDVFVTNNDEAVPAGNGTDATGTAYTAIGLDAATKHEYYVKPACGDAWMGPFTAFTATAIEGQTFSYGFDTPVADGGISEAGLIADGWLTNAQAGNPQAGAQMVFSRALSTGTTPTDNWLFMMPLHLEAGTPYNLNFFTRVFVGTAAQSLRLTVGTDDTSVAQTTELWSNTGLTGNTWTAQSATYTPTTTGTYYFAFHHNSPVQAANPQNVLGLDSFSITNTLGTNEILASQFSVYPNPATNVINIANAENILVNGVTIVDINGRTVKSVKFDNVSEAQINISDLASGMYLMNISSDKGTTTKKIVKN